MAPKKAKGAPKALLKELAATRKRPVAVKGPVRGPQGALLTVTGCAATAAGLALTVAPNLSWKASQIMVGFDYLGVHGGALVMGGLTLIGLGLVMRRCQQVAAQVLEAGSDSGLVDDVAARVMQLGSTLEGLEIHLRSLREELDVRFGGMSANLEKVGRDLSAQLDQPPSDGLGSEDAIFRLAASLDKVGARIEERLKTQFGDLTERIGKVETSLQDAAALIEEVASRPAAYADLEPASGYDAVPDYEAYAPAPGPAYPAAPMHGTQFHAAPASTGGYGGREPAPASSYPAPGLHQTQHHPAPQLHQTQHHPAPQLHQPQHPPQQQQQQPQYQQPPRYRQPQPPATQEDANSLGLLDHLDDDGVRSPLPGTQQQQQHQQGSFDALDELSLQVPPPAAGRWDVQQDPGGESLLSDPEMRSALEDLGRQGGR